MLRRIQQPKCMTKCVWRFTSPSTQYSPQCVWNTAQSFSENPSIGAAATALYLYERRTKLCRQGSQEQFDAVQKAIKESSLQDFERWVQEWSDKISKAESVVGDTRGIYKGVNSLARKKSKPPANLNTDKDGNMLQGAYSLYCICSGPGSNLVRHSLNDLLMHPLEKARGFYSFFKNLICFG